VCAQLPVGSLYSNESTNHRCESFLILAANSLEGKRPGWAVLRADYVNEADSRGVGVGSATMFQGSSSSMRLTG